MQNNIDLNNKSMYFMSIAYFLCSFIKEQSQCRNI